MGEFEDFYRRVEEHAAAEGPEAQAELEELKRRFTFACQVAQKRLSQNLTQKQLAEVSGLSQADVSRIERGLANPTLDTLGAIAQALNVQVCLQEQCPARFEGRETACA